MRKKVLLIRLDKIGDLICTLPADQILDPKVYDVTWVVQKGLGKILDLGERPRNYIELDKNKPDIAREMLAVYLKRNKFDFAVSFQCPWWVNFEIFKDKVPIRIGVRSQWHSFIFLNKGLRQKRSQALKHEFDYNLELVEKITGPASESKENIYFKIRKPNSANVIRKYNLPASYVVVHPGMMGSALNWPQEKYIEYIQKLIDQGQTVVVTGTDADEPYLNKIKSTFLDLPKVVWLQSKLNFEQLIEVLYYCEKVIAPSTGVAHLAASLDKEVHGIYSPITVHHPKRWAPRGPNVHVYLPAPGQGMETIDL